MNLIITTKCNKGCSFCFAKNDDHQEMSLDTFRRILDKIEETKKVEGVEEIPVKLLGGEPTAHKNFVQFLEEIEKRNLQAVIVSNFLFREEIRYKIADFIAKVETYILVNASNLNDSIINKWADNYNTIYSYSRMMDIEERINCGYTFEESKNWEYYINYTDYLLKNIYKIENLRMSMQFPGFRDNKENFYFINNKELGKKFFMTARKAIDVGAGPLIDCIVYPCMFENWEEYKFVRKFCLNFNTKCPSPANDVFPDYKAIYCYPLKNNISINSKDLTVIETEEALINKYGDLKSKINLPETCKTCRHLNIDQSCNGPCLAFFDLQKGFAKEI
jgi:organic radical activating enzyme